jgi:hypothetical protein
MAPQPPYNGVLLGISIGDPPQPPRCFLRILRRLLVLHRLLVLRRLLVLHRLNRNLLVYVGFIYYVNKNILL